MSYFTYILRCSDDSLYTGSTNDIEKRLHEHNNLKSGAHYTKIRRPVELIYTEIFETMSEARKREYVIKQLTREQKISLIRK
ncbi:GIY-YIG nuclease family protein [Candidatus Gracilibacteria bacterium]|nr:GIY-YIG nuclease family protein [bacterium]NDK19822.1 GIY-YIG nuclease family protein [Candidatus Gracilibacteria bacterium]OIO76164.1 MAG: endonuclease [Candidatus Gracilibacteria bacterium CG1_02_38_174]PIQ11731.1 MAG: endonuclease [Candidatus Gracilibacteria bacterium CG18_big_fil_WC_8_21_14_2_50_38_16]PIQ41004.1 MAG: endonuclease [Candidatus Gracilibacteria bacterium CG12_big_fil_rev_8_21_14_0_65_38_15]PIZ01955.1 MAG: endonuclease [Candidatus Gracilibacteria bacterium CG_4_10_14_0_8_um_